MGKKKKKKKKKKKGGTNHEIFFFFLEEERSHARLRLPPLLPTYSTPRTRTYRAVQSAGRHEDHARHAHRKIERVRERERAAQIVLRAHAPSLNNRGAQSLSPA